MNSRGLHRRISLEPIALAALLLEVFLGSVALISGLILTFNPDGSSLGLSPEAVAASPFGSYFLPGLVMTIFFGLGGLGAAWLVFSRQRLAPRVTLVLGAALMAWIGIDALFIHGDPSVVFAVLLAGALMAIGLVWEPVSVRRRL